MSRGLGACALLPSVPSLPALVSAPGLRSASERRQQRSPPDDRKLLLLARNKSEAVHGVLWASSAGIVEGPAGPVLREPLSREHQRLCASALSWNNRVFQSSPERLRYVNSQSGDLIFGYRKKRIQATSHASSEVTAEANAKAADNRIQGTSTAYQSTGVTAPMLPSSRVLW